MSVKIYHCKECGRTLLTIKEGTKDEFPMKELKAFEQERGNTSDTASSEMCTFLILNISSLQLIPVSIIAFRTEYGSVAPTAIVGPAILATAVSTGIAIFYIKIRKYIYRKLFDR